MEKKTLLGRRNSPASVGHADLNKGTDKLSTDDDTTGVGVFNGITD